MSLQNYDNLSIDEVRGVIESDLFPRLEQIITIPELQEHRLHQLAKDIFRFVGSTLAAPEIGFVAQQREFDSLQKSISRTLSSLEKISAGNRIGLDQEVLYRPPFNGRFYFAEQLEYWAANEDSVKRTEDLLKMLSWAAQRLSAENQDTLALRRGSKSKDLNYFIFDMSGHFEEWTGAKAKSKCYYSAARENYSGEFFDVVVCTLQIFAPNSFHSEAALGKRIVRLLSERT